MECDNVISVPYKITLLQSMYNVVYCITMGNLSTAIHYNPIFPTDYLRIDS